MHITEAAGVRTTPARLVKAFGLVLLLAWLFPLSALAAGQGGDAALVLHVTGRWAVRGSGGDLAPGGTIRSGVTVDPVAPSAGDRIVLALFTGQAETHSTSFTVPVQVEPGLVSRVWRAIAGTYRPTYVPTLTRGRQLADGVVRIGPGETIDLSAWSGGQDGPREVELRRLTPTGQPVLEPAGPFRLAADPAAWKSLKAAGVNPGLFELTIRPPAAAGVAAGTQTCWVLLVAGDGADEADRAFQEAVALTRTWPADVPATAVRAFLRSYLVSLDQGPREAR